MPPARAPRPCAPALPADAYLLNAQRARPVPGGEARAAGQRPARRCPRWRGQLRGISEKTTRGLIDDLVSEAESQQGAGAMRRSTSPRTCSRRMPPRNLAGLAVLAVERSESRATRGYRSSCRERACAKPASVSSRAVEGPRVVEANRAAGRTLAVAESCTGGLVAAALTEIPGSSDVFEAGFVTYSNEAKMALLGVSEDVLETFGAVSVAVAWAMAQGALEALRGRYRGRDHRHRRTRRRQREEAGRHGGVRPRAARRRSQGDRRRHQGFRRSRPRRRPASGGALRARAADAGRSRNPEAVKRRARAPRTRRSSGAARDRTSVRRAPRRCRSGRRSRRRSRSRVPPFPSGRNFQLLCRYLSGPSI